VGRSDIAKCTFHGCRVQLEDSGVKVSEQKTLQVLELDPNFVPALQRYGAFRWMFDGKLTEAIQIIEHGIALDPNNPWLRYTAVEVYLDLGEVEAARDVAAGTPQGARTTGLLSMHEGDWRRAGLAAYDEAGWTSDDDTCKNLLASAAIRDYALKTGELSRAIAFIKLKYYLGDDPAAHLEVCNFHAVVYLSQLMGRCRPSRAGTGAATCRVIVARCQRGQVFYGRWAHARRIFAARRQTGRGARRSGGCIPFRDLCELVVHHKLRSVVAAAPRRQAISGDRVRRAALCRRAAQRAGSAATARGRAEARTPDTARAERQRRR